MKSYALILAYLFALAGCTLAEVQVNVASERTALENQVLGSYNALTRDVLMVASVRGVNPMGEIEEPPRQSPEKQDTMEAMQVLAFHADDVDRFKALGWVGENNEGLLKRFELSRENIPDDLKAFAERYTEAEFNAVFEAVNGARERVMQRVVEVNENFSERDLPEIQRVFGKINRDNARPGEKIQTDDGSWTVKQ
jgi:uncharacterized protein YdbL (DUF1318 family)